MRLTLLTAGQKRFKAAFYLAFGGITVILALAVGLALYAFAQLGQTVERTTREILPETLAALRLSERSALLAALAPTLANAGDHAQLQQLAAQLEGLIAEIPKHISQLKVWIEPNASAILRDRVAFLATTLRMLREANADRITLEQRQRALLAEIGRVHSELNDTVGPVVYGVTSLNQVLAKRDVRRQISTLRELWEHHNRQYTAVVSLRLLLDALKTTPSKIQQNGSSSAAMRELTRGALAELQVTHHAEQAPEVARLSAVVGQWLQREPPQWPNAALQQELITALEQFLEQIEGYLAKHMQESLEQIQTNLLTLLEQRGRNLIYALDIRGEGNLLFAMLTTAAETRGAEHLALLQERFNRAQELFRFAATAFRTSELAQRNPVLADNMHNIEQALARFGEGDTNVFAVRQQIRDLEDRIEHLLADSRRIAKAVTDQSDVLVRRVQVETNALQTAQIAQQRTLEWGLLWVCGGGVLLAGLIVWSTGRILDRHERDLHAARVAADRASEAKSRFLANMSHEIRTPMNGVLGMLQLLEKTALDGRQRDYLTTACGSAGMLLTVINDILDVSKMEAGRLRLEIIVFDLRQQITELTELLKREALRKGLYLTSVVAEQVPRQVRGDPVRLNQVLMNLLGNAIKFTEQGEVALRVEPVDQGRLRFVIRDTGIGMTE
ncbi:MAG: histidine kinase dimerization/phospho-acceptor domain-containing protein, partial [Candidatus Contendobacter sp.]